mmetsp:Transcript_63334/g.151347  ORF Transcript_63334/g.151347 Transcript_63334/m.151347 type:complete len:246 (-) Transcript_63334:49-786(-)
MLEVLLQLENHVVLRQVEGLEGVRYLPANLLHVGPRKGPALVLHQPPNTALQACRKLLLPWTLALGRDCLLQGLLRRSLHCRNMGRGTGSHFREVQVEGLGERLDEVVQAAGHPLKDHQLSHEHWRLRGNLGGCRLPLPCPQLHQSARGRFLHPLVDRSGLAENRLRRPQGICGGDLRMLQDLSDGTVQLLLFQLGADRSQLDLLFQLLGRQSLGFRGQLAQLAGKDCPRSCQDLVSQLVCPEVF